MVLSIFKSDDWLIDEVLVYYDGPKLFVTSHTENTNTKYLNNWLDAGKDFDEWLLVPVKEEDIERLKNGIISLRELTLLSIDGSATKLKTIHDEEKTNIVTNIKITELTEEELPDPDTYFSPEEFKKK